MTYDLPTFVIIDGEKHSIRNDCDYRVVLDTINALNDSDLTKEQQIYCALQIFYENANVIKDIETAIKEMYRIISVENDEEKHSPDIVDWEQDFKNISPPVSMVLGYDIRTPQKYTHWWTLIGAYMEIHDCTFSTVLSIRHKRATGKKLEKWERDFVRENPKLTAVPQKLTAEEKEFLFGED